MMTLFSFDPFESLLQLQRELERTLTAPLLPLNGGTNVFPLVNVFSDREGFVVRAEVPGFEADQIELTIEPNSLTLKGERPPDERKKPGSYHRRERQFGSFARTIRLPEELDAEKATAGCRNGLLTIRIPKAEAAKPRQIPIKSAA
jgi:HSP20 family protein